MLKYSIYRNPSEKQNKKRQNAVHEPGLSWLCLWRARDHRNYLLSSELEQFAHAFDLGAAYGNFGVLLVVHFQHEGGVEPRNDFLDVMNVHQERAVRPPEGIGIQ